MNTVSRPVTSIDLYTDDAILSPYDRYREIRDAGPIVWMERHDAWVVARYQQVRAVLRDTDTFTSTGGVSLNDPFNAALQGTTLASDPPEHDHLRKITVSSLTPRALAKDRSMIEGRADRLVAELVERGEFDAVADLARVLPLAVVPDFIGLPETGRDRMLDWASAVFDAIGPMNERTEQALPVLGELGEYAAERVAARDFAPGSLGAGVIAAADEGRIPLRQCPALLLDYLGPALDTTISAVGSAIWLFASHPDQWDKVRQNPSLIPNAFNEVLRVETPIRGFCRHTTRPTNVDGVDVGAGERVLVLYASANRDERKWEKADVFDVARPSGDHVGFGYGVRGCPGQGLARIEAHAVLAGLAGRVGRFELKGAERSINNVIRAFSSVTVAVTGGEA